MHYNEPRNIGGMVGITPAVRFLLVLNIAVFVLESWFHVPLGNTFALPAAWWQHFSFGKLFTYMFVHASFSHLFMNMLGLFFIGPAVEQTIGSYRFFVLYYLSGILGGLGWSLLAKSGCCVGASGAFMGILGAFGALYPNAQLLLWFVLPIRAWVLVLILAAWELHETIGEPLIGGIANAAHLFGGIAGFCYAFSLKHPHVVAELRQRLGLAKAAGSRRAPGTGARSQTLSPEEVDRILDKIGRQGMGALTPRERELLKKATRG